MLEYVEIVKGGDKGWFVVDPIFSESVFDYRMLLQSYSRHKI